MCGRETGTESVGSAPAPGASGPASRPPSDQGTCVDRGPYQAFEKGLLGKFAIKVVVKGCATAGAIGISHIGIYVKDSFDFKDKPGEDQPLGYWNKQTEYIGRNPFRGTAVHNSDYKFYGENHGFNGDFHVFSDLVVIKLSPKEVILKSNR